MKYKTTLLFITLIFIASITLLGGCKSKHQSRIDPKKGMIGVFVRDTQASLSIDDINSGGHTESIDFQLSFEVPSINIGTLFGSADQTDNLIYHLNYESIGVIHQVTLHFKSPDWHIKYTAEDPESKTHFNYSGLYRKKK
jgi:hypothetical protein